MSSKTQFLEEIPGFLKVGYLFKGLRADGERVSIVILADGPHQVTMTITEGLDVTHPGLTKKMRSYLSGMADVSRYLAQRSKEDEDGVSPTDIENAAMMLAFPKVAKNGKALEMLKAHLALLERHKILARTPAPKAAPAPTPQPKPAPEAAPMQLSPAEAVPGTAQPKAALAEETVKPSAQAEAKPNGASKDKRSFFRPPQNR